MTDLRLAALAGEAVAGPGPRRPVRSLESSYLTRAPAAYRGAAAGCRMARTAAAAAVAA